MEPLKALLELRFQAREAREGLYSATTEADRLMWASRLAVALSELQHPALVTAAKMLEQGGEFTS